MASNRWAKLSVTGVATAGAVFAFEAAKQALHPAITIWTSHFATIIFVTALAVVLSFVLQRREERSRRELNAESKERQRAEAELRQSEDRMRMAIEAARIGFFDWDLTCDTQVWSDTAKQLLGLDPDSPMDFTVLSRAVHPADRQGLYRAIEGVTRQKPDFTYEHRACWRNDTVHWIWVKGRGFFGGDGRLLKISGIAMDIDERKQAEERLRLHAAALEEAANGVVLTDNQGTILWVNRAFTQMTGYAAEEAIGQNPRLLKSGKQDEAFYAGLWNTIAGGNVWRGELVNRKKDGSLYSEEMTIAPVRSDAGGVSHYLAIKQDITQRRVAEQALQNAEQKYRGIFENAVLGIFQSTLEGVFLSVNPALSMAAGYDSPEEFMKGVHSVSEVYVDPKRPEELRKLIVAQKVVRDFEAELKSRDGSKRTVSMNVRAVADHRGNFYLDGTIQDITRRKLAEQALQNAEQKYRSIFENAVLGIFQTNLEGDFLSVNPALARLGGYESPEDFLNHVHGAAEIYVDIKRRNELRELLMAQKVVRDFEVEVRTKDGGTRTTSINVGAVADSEGKASYLEGTVQDITERKAAEARVQFLAYHDALTGLPNRVLFEDRLAKALANARRREEQVAVLWLDLDNFKTINDSLGHSVGDLLLKQLGERLHKHTRAQDTVAKVGGDEFIFALSNPDLYSRGATAAERIRRAVSRKFEVQGHVLNVTCSIGISLFPDHGENGETLLKNADLAMYCAKENGRDNFRFFTPELNAKAEERLTLENSLHVALEKKSELFLMYQPQMEVATGRITGGEALLRWRHPELGLVAPDRFIPIAENSGLIVPIGEWVLKTACTQARCWQDQGLPALPIAVNVSAVQFHQAGFLPLIRQVLDETGLAPQYLELELTERVLLSNAERTLALLQELSGMGLQLSIDDFGAGYSSLSYLQDLPVCKLKIDRSFMRAMEMNPRDAAITAAVIGMGHSLNLKVIAEGVETEEQMLFLRAHGCDEIQGFYFSQALEADAFAEKVRLSWLQPELSSVARKLLPATASAPRELEDVLCSSR